MFIKDQKELASIEILYCNNTKNEEIPEGLINLKTLIKKLPNDLKKLKYLNCSNSKITEIPKDNIKL